MTITVEGMIGRLEAQERIDELIKEIDEIVKKVATKTEDGDKANRHTEQKCKARNIGFKEIYNSSGILFVLSYDLETGKILDIIEVPSTDPNPVFPDPISPIQPFGPYNPDPYWWNYQNTSDTVKDNENTITFQSEEEFIEWLDKQECK